MSSLRRPEIAQGERNNQGGYHGKGAPIKTQPGGSCAAQSASNTQNSDAIAPVQPHAPQASRSSRDELVGPDLKDALIRSGYDSRYYEAVDLGVAMIIIRTPLFNDVQGVEIYERRSIEYRYIGHEIDEELIEKEIEGLSEAIGFTIELEEEDRS